MASEVKTDKLSQRGSSGIVITDDIKLSSGKAIKQADGTDLLTEAGLLTPASDVKLASGKAIKNASGAALLSEDGALGSGVTAGGRLCKAWVSWIQTTHVIGDSFNVSSVGDAGTGQPQINLTTPMSNVNYAVAGIPHHNNGVVASGMFSVYSLFTVSQIHLSRYNSQGNAYEVAYKDSIVVFGN